jgi:hypothetical protein
VDFVTNKEIANDSPTEAYERVGNREESSSNSQSMVGCRTGASHGPSTGRACSIARIHLGSSPSAVVRRRSSSEYKDKSVMFGRSFLRLAI